MWVATRNVLGYAAVLALVSLPSLSAAPRTTITVMTQNMDAGTDLGFALAYLFTPTPTVGIDLTYQEILQGNFAGRAGILAQQIAALQPDLVSLQEVTLWSVGPDPFSLVPIIDQLQLLLGALAALGQDYSVLQDASQHDVIQNLTIVAAPMSDGRWLGYRDRNVVLKRNNAGFRVSNVREDLFAAKFSLDSPLGPLTVVQGWIAADITLGSNTFTFVNTHLAGSLTGLPLADLQEAQADELAVLFGGTGRTVIAGDFNSNATHTPPEQTRSVMIIEQAGFTDTWPTANHGQPGFTWPLYVEDPLAAHPNGPFERIDFVFESGLGIDFVNRIGWTGAHASDHAGVIAGLSF